MNRLIRHSMFVSADMQLMFHREFEVKPTFVIVLHTFIRTLVSYATAKAKCRSCILTN
jgi:hypothetical protein